MVWARAGAVRQHPRPTPLSRHFGRHRAARAIVDRTVTCAPASPCRTTRVADHDPHHHPAGMFVVTEAEATAIPTAFDQGGEFAAAVELRRLFPAVTDNAQARECARTIAAWEPLQVKPRLGRLPGKRR